MNILEKLEKSSIDGEEDGLFAMQLAKISILPMVLKTTMELDLLEIMAEKGEGAQSSASELASRLPTKNPDAPSIVDKMLRLLASYSILTCSTVTDEQGHVQNLYGLAPVCKFLTRDRDESSLAPYTLMSLSRPFIAAWDHLKEAVLEGVSPFEKENGMGLFEFVGRNKTLFNEAMYHNTMMVMTKLLEKYKGFEGLHQLLDVGGGLGANLRLIVSKYPQIQGINFDLPHVVQDAPPCPEHVGGDMFVNIPKGEVIFLKWILHDWDDDRCTKILKNCYDALPETGKVIVVEAVIPEFVETDVRSRNVFKLDMTMINATSGGKERTEKELESLARRAGFAAIKLICSAYCFSIFEFYKRP
ncbi:caffeic acid 3-O-methyltransferase 1 isoform X2 [Manihot esculenta]|uniref:caffeic acid 3-O-methyltransferase 1 isoform X2 n=1 Tax=Manihot esculenta TaxID=3983 RepID=UPI000B5D5C50|nr:caffeic acid 3-O-methyltransferase 1 isoform X2 [Manihot esculenta]